MADDLSTDTQYLKIIAQTPPIPSGAATYAGQTAGNASLASIKTAVEGPTPAGEAHIGVMGGHTTVIAVSPTVDTSIYASGDLIGGKLSIANAARVAAGSGTIQGVVLADQAKQDAAIDVVFFSADPTGTTFTDQAALDVADADNLNIIGVIKILASDYSDFNDNSNATKSSQGLPFKLASGTSIYAALVCRGTPTYAAATDLQLKVKIYQD